VYRSEPRQCIEKSTQIKQRSDGNARTRFHVHRAACCDVKHPRRHCEKHAVVQLDNEAVFGLAAKSPYDVTFMVEKRMMPVADPHRR